MIDIRAGVLAITICLLIALANDRPNEYGMRVGGHWVPCNILDRYENA